MNMPLLDNELVYLYCLVCSASFSKFRNVDNFMKKEVGNKSTQESSIHVGVVRSDCMLV